MSEKTPDRGLKRNSSSAKIYDDLNEILRLESRRREDALVDTGMNRLLARERASKAALVQELYDRAGGFGDALPSDCRFPPTPVVNPNVNSPSKDNIPVEQRIPRVYDIGTPGNLPTLLREIRGVLEGGCATATALQASLNDLLAKLAEVSYERHGAGPVPISESDPESALGKTDETIAAVDDAQQEVEELLDKPPEAPPRSRKRKRGTT